MRLGSTALTTERVERRLAAILAADVANYSRLMGADEEGTLARLKALRRELADPKIKEHRGRIVKTTGDGLLIEFANVVDAVRCAVEVQREMATRNARIPPDRRIEFRIGVNLGTSSSRMAIFSATGSISPPALRHWPSRAAYAPAAWCAIKCATNSISHLRIWANNRSRTSPDRCARIASLSVQRPRCPPPIYHPTSYPYLRCVRHRESRPS